MLNKRNSCKRQELGKISEIHSTKSIIPLCVKSVAKIKISSYILIVM